ncbi:hypothetical protein HDV03_001364 [Kappamyces sp. JEL0829]|nr:hypothetical protein HDV03_001364 [Kappamyces sp. JEL0829]
MATVAKHLLDSFKKGQDTYLVGCTNAGKSSLMNYWKKKLGHSQLITMAATSGTTAGLIKLSLSELAPVLGKEMNQDTRATPADAATTEPKDDSAFLVDTAGIVHQQQLCHLLAADHLNYTTPKAPLKNHVLELEDGTSYWIGGLVRLDINKKSHQKLTGQIKLTISPKIPVHTSMHRKPPAENRQFRNMSAALWPLGKGGTKLPALSTAGNFRHANDHFYFVSALGAKEFL